MSFDHEEPAIAELSLDAIRVEGRFRRDPGDITSLADSIAEVGLLHPVVVTPDYRLIAGERRIAAYPAAGAVDHPGACRTDQRHCTRRVC